MFIYYVQCLYIITKSNTNKDFVTYSDFVLIYVCVILRDNSASERPVIRPENYNYASLCKRAQMEATVRQTVDLISTLRLVYK